MSEFLLKHNITTENELMVIAKQCHDDGEKDVYYFIVNKTQITKKIQKYKKYEIHL